MRQQHLDEFGSVILGREVRKVVGIDVPEVATQEVFRKLQLRELDAVDYVRNLLMGEGKYLAQHCGDYRILLPSENIRQVESYMSQAKNKLSRGMKLLRNSPKTDQYNPHDDPSGRLLMTQEAIKQAQQEILK